MPHSVLHIQYPSTGTPSRHPPTNPLVDLPLTIFPAKLTSTKGSTKFFLLLSKPKICFTLSITASSTEEKDMLITAHLLSHLQNPHFPPVSPQSWDSLRDTPWTPQPRAPGRKNHLRIASPEGTALLPCPAPNSWFTVPPVLKGFQDRSN